MSDHATRAQATTEAYKRILLQILPEASEILGMKVRIEDDHCRAVDCDVVDSQVICSVRYQTSGGPTTVSIFDDPKTLRRFAAALTELADAVEASNNKWRPKAVGE